METLDNPVWHALSGPHTRFAERSGSALGSRALRYQPEVATFAALPDDAGPDAWEALGRLVGPHGMAVIFRPAPVTLPDGWRVAIRMPTLQMVAAQPIGRVDDDFVVLGTGDATEMLALVERTKPGPFATRTVELGTYLGRRDADAGNALIAMAGERVRPPGYTEVSAVCTDPDARKQGLATRLVRAVAAGIEARGDTPILHVLAENRNAIRVYETIGFETRAAFDTLIVRAPR